MKIVITKANNPTCPTCWYEDKIGEVFEVEETLEKVGKHITSYRLVSGLRGAVSFEDCEEVLEHNSQLYHVINRPVREGDMVVIADAEGTFNMNRNGDTFEVDNMFILGKLSRKAATFRGGNDDEKYTVLELIEPPVTPQAPSYAEISELLHEASRQTRIDKAFDKVVARNGAVLKRLADSDKQSPTLTETDLIANLAQEVAELKRELSEYKASIAHRGRTLEINVGELKDDIADLEDRLDENEKDTEEVIGRMNDLGDGAEAAAVVSVEAIEKVIAELEVKKSEATLRYSKYENMGEKELAQFYDGKELGFKTAIRKIEEALRNG